MRGSCLVIKMMIGTYSVEYRYKNPVKQLNPNLTKVLSGFVPMSGPLIKLVSALHPIRIFENT